MTRGNRWGAEGPPPEAYSRVTEPERVEPLHPLAEELLRRLEDEFDVGRTEGYGLDPELEGKDLAHPTVRLVPSIEGAASITVAFTTFPFPGLGVRFGLWHRFSFPTCAC